MINVVETGNEVQLLCVWFRSNLQSINVFADR